MVLTTHYMEEAAVLCDDIVIVDHGRVVARGSPEALVHSLGGEQLIEFALADELPEDDVARAARGARGAARRPRRGPRRPTRTPSCPRCSTCRAGAA